MKTTTKLNNLLRLPHSVNAVRLVFYAIVGVFVLSLLANSSVLLGLVDHKSLYFYQVVSLLALSFVLCIVKQCTSPMTAILVLDLTALMLMTVSDDFSQIKAALALPGAMMLFLPLFTASIVSKVAQKIGFGFNARIDVFVSNNRQWLVPSYVGTLFILGLCSQYEQFMTLVSSIGFMLFVMTFKDSLSNFKAFINRYALAQLVCFFATYCLTSKALVYDSLFFLSCVIVLATWSTVEFFAEHIYRDGYDRTLGSAGLVSSIPDFAFWLSIGLVSVFGISEVSLGLLDLTNFNPYSNPNYGTGFKIGTGTSGWPAQPPGAEPSVVVDDVDSADDDDSVSEENNESNDFWWKVAAVVVGAVIGAVVVWYFLGPSDNGDPKVTAKTQPTVADKTYNDANLAKYKGNAYYAQHSVSQNSNNAPVLIAVTPMDQSTFINHIINSKSKIPGFETMTNTDVVNAVNKLVSEAGKTYKTIPLAADTLDEVDALKWFIFQVKVFIPHLIPNKLVVKFTPDKWNRPD